jgi:hypothetical protein
MNTEKACAGVSVEIDNRVVKRSWDVYHSKPHVQAKAIKVLMMSTKDSCMIYDNTLLNGL